jgi:predicted transposase/invertase (TIGR01784 family)
MISDGDLELLASLLSSILEIDIYPKDITVTNAELPKSHESGKESRIDVRVRLSDGKHVNVEIQIADEHDIAKRSIYYLSRLYADQMKEGMDYAGICPAIAINILDFDYLPFEKYHNCYRMKNLNYDHELTEAFEINFIELRKVTSAGRSSLKDLWALFIAADCEEVLDMLSDENPIMKKAVEKLEYISSDEELRYALDMREKAALEYHSGIASSYKKGKAEGKADERSKIAEKMKASGIPVDEIVKFTDLSVDEIGKL